MTGRRFFGSTVKSLTDAGLLTDLVEYWKFDINTNGELGANQITSANVSIASGGKINNGALGVAGATLTFPHNANYSFTDGVSDLPFSISLWFNITSFSSIENMLINKRDSASTEEWSIQISPTGFLSMTLYSGGTATIFLKRNTSVSFSVSNYNHVVVTYDGSELSSGINIYINGVLNASVNNSSGVYTGMLGTSSILQFFRLRSINNFVHRGYIDEVGLWKNRVLNLSEVQELYNAGAGLQYPF